MFDDPEETAPVESETPSESKPAKKKARRPNGKSERKPREPRAGGIGSRLSPEKVSDDERKVLLALKKAKEPTKVSEIAAACWSGKKTKGDADEGSPVSAYRRVINALRRLRARSLVKSERTTEAVPGKKTGRTYNLYALSANGTKFVENME